MSKVNERVPNDFLRAKNYAVSKNYAIKFAVVAFFFIMKRWNDILANVWHENFSKTEWFSGFLDC